MIFYKLLANSQYAIVSRDLNNKTNDNEQKRIYREHSI